MANFYLSSAGYTSVAQWSASTAVTIGEYRRQLATPANNNFRVFRCTTGGTTGGAEPSWTITNNGNTNDNGVIWQCISGQEAHQAAANWTAPCANVGSLVSQLSPTQLDTIYVSTDHAENINNGPVFTAAIISVSRAGGSSMPPVAADISSGATFTGTNNSTISVQMRVYARGITIATAGSGGRLELAGSNGGDMSEYDMCTFNNAQTGTAVFTLGTNPTFTGRMRLRNCTFIFGNVGQSIATAGSVGFEIINPTITGVSPITNLFGNGVGFNAFFIVRDADFSTGITNVRASGRLGFTNFDFYNCRFPAGQPIFPTIGNSGLAGSDRFWNCTDGTTTYSYLENNTQAQIISSGQVARQDGANDGAAGFTLRISTGQNGNNRVSYGSPYRTPPISANIQAIGSPVTATLEFISSLALTTADVFLETETLETSGSLGTFNTTRPATVLTAGSGLSTQTNDFTQGTVAFRANSTAYAKFAVYKAASNPDRVFICITAGTSAGSEPGGVATAVDGSSITDGTATFIAAYRYRLDYTFTPGRVGDVQAQFCVANDNANLAIFLDPLLTIA